MSFWPLGSSRVEAGICGSRAELFSYLNDLPSSFEISLALSNIHLQEDQEDKA